MLYQLPSGSKSSASGCATGCARSHLLRFASILSFPFSFTRLRLDGSSGCPCEQPTPIITYILLSENAMSAGPSTAPVWLRADGSPSATVVRLPAIVTREIRPVNPPVHGPIGAGTYWHCPTVAVSFPPCGPASATQ